VLSTSRYTVAVCHNERASIFLQQAVLTLDTEHSATAET